MNIKELLSNLSKNFYVNKPEILSALGITGFIISGVVAVKNTPEAMDRIDSARRKKSREKPEEPFNGFDKIRASAGCYILPIVMAGASAGCIICSNRISHKRELAMAAAYTVTKDTLMGYRKNIEESFGEKKAKIIEEKVNDDEMRSNNPPDDNFPIQGRGDVLCLDSMSGRYFMSTMDRIKKAEAIINKRLYEDMFVTLNEFYDEIELDCNESGELLGWNVKDAPISIWTTTQLTPNDKPCIVVRYDVGTKYHIL